MRIKALSVALGVLSSGWAWASDAPTPETFSGVWQGKGVYLTNGEHRVCNTATFVFEATERSMVFSGGRECDGHTETFDKIDMQFADGSLLYKDTKVGEIEGNVMTAGSRMPDTDGGVRIWRMSMRRQGSTLVYEESRTMEGESEPAIVFAGVLVREGSPQ